MKSKFYSIEETSELSDLSIDMIKKFIQLEAVIPLGNNHKDIRINSYGLTRLKMISKLLDKGLSKAEIIEELDKK